MTADYDARRADIKRRGIALEEEYARIIKDIHDGVMEMKQHHMLHGTYPAHTKPLMVRLRREGLHTKMLILRLHAELIELELEREDPFAGTEVPDGLPEGDL